MDQVRLVVEEKAVSFIKANYHIMLKIERACSNNIILVFTDTKTVSKSKSAKRVESGGDGGRAVNFSH